MKKNLFIFAIFFIVAGCASMQVKRTVQDNMFFSTYPKIAIKINSDFEYLGKTENIDSGTFKDSPDTGPIIKNESYFFVQSKNNRIDKAILIKINEINRGYWLPDLFENVKNNLDSGVIKINEESYQYVFTNSTLANKADNKYVTDKGYITSNCYLWKALGTTISDQVRFLIIYTEATSNIDELKSYKCADWSKKDLLLERQKKFIREFNLRAESNIKLISVNDMTSYTEEIQGGNDLEQKLVRLKELFDKGLITLEEYNNKKTELLKKY